MRFKSFFFSLFLLSVSLGMAIGAGELFFRRKGVVSPGHGKPPDIFVSDQDLGHAGKPSSADTEEFFSPSFTAHYSLNSFGFRNVPGARLFNERCLFLFGDSIAFGLGVDDSETAAALLQKEFPGVRVVNFGITGWGPHHALRLLQINREKDAGARCKEIRSFYFSQFDHVYRSAGRVPYDLSGPKFLRGEKGLFFSGPFYPQWLNGLNNKYLKYSRFGSRLLLFLIGNSRTSPEDVQIYRAILTELKEILTVRYHSSLSVLYFNFGFDPNANDRSLEIKGINTVYFEQAGDKKLSRESFLKMYYLPDGTHPNALGQKRIADLIAATLKDWKKKAPEP